MCNIKVKNLPQVGILKVALEKVKKLSMKVSTINSVLSKNSGNS